MFHGGATDAREYLFSEMGHVEGKSPMVGTFEAHGHGHKHGKK